MADTEEQFPAGGYCSTETEAPLPGGGYRSPEADVPAEEVIPLAAYERQWKARDSDGSLLDRVFGPMVHDALSSEQWRERWEALTYLTNHLPEIGSMPAEFVAAVSQVLVSTANDKMPKVILAALALFEHLVSDSRMDTLSQHEFTQLLHGQADACKDGSSADALMCLFDQADAAGGSSAAAASPQQAAVGAICACVQHGRVPLDEVAFLLLTRIDVRLRGDARDDPKDRKQVALAAKTLEANFKMLNRWVSDFGLQHSGMFRRALVLPLVMCSLVSEHSKVRAAGGDVLVQIISLGGGIEERVMSLIPTKRRKMVQDLVNSKEGLTLTTASPCEEDVVTKQAVVSEDPRAESLACVSQLTPQVWAAYQTGASVKVLAETLSMKLPPKLPSMSATLGRASLATADDSVADEGTGDNRKDWKERVGIITSLSGKFALDSEGVKHVERSGIGDELSGYSLCDYPLSSLQMSLNAFLSDNITAVFLPAADLLRLTCSRLSVDIAPGFLKPLLQPLIARLLDTSSKVRTKTSESTLEIAALHEGALGEMIVQSICGSAAGSAENSTGRDVERSTGPRLQLLVQLMQQAQAAGSGAQWTDATWQALADYSAKAADHRSGDVRRDALALRDSLRAAGERSRAAVSEQLQQITEKKQGQSAARLSMTLGREIDAMHSDINKHADTVKKSFTSKNWKERAEGIALFTKELAAVDDGIDLVEGGRDATGISDVLCERTFCGHQLLMLQTSFVTLLKDNVTAVFTSVADLLRLSCAHMALDIASAFLDPLLPALLGRLLDTSVKVRTTATETILQIAALHECGLSKITAECLLEWRVDCAPGRDRDRGTGPRLQLLQRLVEQLEMQDAVSKWTDEMWTEVADSAVKASDYRSADVRRDAASLLNSLCVAGGQAYVVGERATAELQTKAQEKMCKRPGTGAVRLGTASVRPGTGLDLVVQGESLTSTRPKTGSNFRPGGSGFLLEAKKVREKDVDEESNISAQSEAPECEQLEVGNGDTEGGIKFYDVQTSCPGADEVPDLAVGEAALKEALHLAEQLDQACIQSVGLLITLFGQGWVRCFCSRNWQCRVAALTHLAATATEKITHLARQDAQQALDQLLEGAMHTVHKSLGDHNVHVVVEACMAVTAVVPAFCSTVDAGLLARHLAPITHQLCARMADSKEVVRTKSTQTLLRLLLSPISNILSPTALTVVILRHLNLNKDGQDDSKRGMEHSLQAGSKPTSTAGKVAATGWLCRLAVLRDLVKDHGQSLVDKQADLTHPGEWFRLQDGLAHPDPTVRHQSAALFAQVCEMHTRCLGDEHAQRNARESWVDALQKDIPPKSLAQVRRCANLPEQLAQDGVGQVHRSQALAVTAWEVPTKLVHWTGCKPDALRVLRSPAQGDEKLVIVALKALGEAASDHEAAEKRSGWQPHEAFAGICRSVQQALGNELGADRAVFSCAVDLFQTSIMQLAPFLSGLDIKMGLGQCFPALLECASLAGVNDVKLSVGFDKFVKMIATHPKVGCEAVTKMVINAILKTDRPIRSLVLLRRLLSDFGLRICAHRDIVAQLLGAVGAQLECVDKSADDADLRGVESLRPQLVGVLATCYHFSEETVRCCMEDVPVGRRHLLKEALQEVPDSRLVALGAVAAEQEAAEAGDIAVGSAGRSLSRSLSRSVSRSRGSTPVQPGLSRSNSRQIFPRPEDCASPSTPGSSSKPSFGMGYGRAPLPRPEDGSPPTPGTAARGQSRGNGKESRLPTGSRESRASDISTAASTTSSWSTRASGEGHARPPAPMMLSTALHGNHTSTPGQSEAGISSSKRKQQRSIHRPTS
eukprot:TRINITY_DN19350_c0_g1_i1.p1 TRINITY_DN19350_c0_g1~~TRINITY_DN19350_c0_g1_i1.p1  ORF type:complete len:1819 (-),score=313.02 TRINITY_DN19350_c0_g1_i1:313-5769(-)